MISQHQKPLMSGFGAKTEPSEILENINLADKTVIITGGYSGIGLETTKAIKANGASKKTTLFELVGTIFSFVNSLSASAKL